MEPRPSLPAGAAGTVTFGAIDALTVNRMGYGAMRITGQGVWGQPADTAAAIAVLRRAVDLGVQFIDTADSYGPHVSEELIREALFPYNDVLVATKGGLTRQGPDRWTPVGHPAYLRQCVEMSLRRLGVERIDLWQLHRIAPDVPMEDQAGEIAALVQEGKIRHVGLSQVSIDEVEAFHAIVPVVSVQNMYNVGQRADDALVDHCAATGRVFIPWFPVAAGPLAKSGADVDPVARRQGGTTGAEHAGSLQQIAAAAGLPTSQVALAWLLHRSPAIAPIPGTSSVAHLEENTAAAGLTLTPEALAALDALAS